MPEQRPEADSDGAADSEWFRPPTRRERWIAAGVFVAFGLFFIVLFWVQKHWWFRWVVLGLGIVSIWRGVRHATEARRSEI